MTTPKGIQDLSLEMILTIFRNITDDKDRENVLTVTKQFRASSFMIFFENLEITSVYRRLSRIALAMQPYQGYVRKLRLFELEDEHLIGVLQSIPQLTRLKKLSSHYCDQMSLDSNSSLLELALQHLTSLTSIDLDIDRSPLTFDTSNFRKIKLTGIDQQINTDLPPMQYLECLKLSESYDIEFTASVVEYSLTSDKFPHLKRLKLYNVEMLNTTSFFPKRMETLTKLTVE
ncbi:hypothetical protein ACJ72_08161 [Emergomyces africanus]|uniref:F-box domain-containing protein n=1 Tax=Emergomyces africanus TaxID=1955775 RepID=A0A1B7NLS2_9EURO|nr:hypothetical protein ACJ72_08161 [Emergomyces africanus]